MTFFGQDLGNRAAHSHQEFLAVPPPPGISTRITRISEMKQRTLLPYLLLNLAQYYGSQNTLVITNEKETNRVPTTFRHVFPSFVRWKHVRRCRCRSSFPKVDDFGFLECSNINQHDATATNSRRVHVYNSQTKHSGDGCVYGRTVTCQGIIANTGTFFSVGSNCLSLIGSPQRRGLVGLFRLFFVFSGKIPTKKTSQSGKNKHHNHYYAYDSLSAKEKHKIRVS